MKGTFLDLVKTKKNLMIEKHTATTKTTVLKTSICKRCMYLNCKQVTTARTQGYYIVYTSEKLRVVSFQEIVLIRVARSKICRFSYHETMTKSGRPTKDSLDVEYKEVIVCKTDQSV